MPDERPKLTHTQHAVRGLRLVGSARLFSQCITWSLTVITVRLLQPRDYGVVATAGLFTVLASVITDGGLGDILVFRRDLSARQEGAAAIGCLLLSLLLAALIVLVAPAGGDFFRNPALVNVLRVSALQLPLSAIAVVPFALLSKEMRYGKIAVIQTSVSILQGLATLGMAYAGQAYWALIYGTLFGLTIRAGAFWFILKQRPPLNWRIWELRPMLRDSFHMVGQRLLFFGSADFDIFLLGRLSGAAALGPYSLAKTLSHSALDQISGTVNQITLPSFAAKAGDHEAQFSALKTIIATSATVVFPLFWFAGVISPVAFPLVFGPRWSALVFPFAAFTVLLPLRTVFALLGSAVVGTGNTSTTFINMIVWALIMTPILVVGALLGPNATAVAWVIGFPLVFLSAMHRIARSFKTTPLELLRPLFIPAKCAAATAAVVEVITLSLKAELPQLALLAIQCILVVAIYLLLMRRFGRNQYDQAMGLAWQLLGR
jgi:O-antigen/teichoic acid export membrane protein